MVDSVQGENIAHLTRVRDSSGSVEDILVVEDIGRKVLGLAVDFGQEFGRARLQFVFEL